METKTILNGGDYIKGETVKYPNMSKPGYAFLGWSIDPNSKTPDFLPGSTSVFASDSDVTVYGVWSEYGKWNITYKGLPDDSEYVHNSETYKFMDLITLLIPERIFGYNFIGWDIIKSSDISVLENRISGNYIMPDFDIIANAVWDRGGTPYHKIRYIYNNETPGLTITNGIVAGSSSTVRNAEAMRITYYGHDFLNWTDGVNIYNEDSQIYNVYSDISLRANWVDGQKYTITYNLNGGDGIVPNEETVYKGDSVILSDGKSTARDGYQLKGWSTTSTSVLPQYSLSQYITPDSNMTLYCVWESIPKFTVRYHVMNGCEKVVDENEYNYNDKVLVKNVLCNGSDNTSCTLWNTRENGTGVSFEAGDSFTITENMDLFQKCESCYASFITNNPESVLIVNGNTVKWGYMIPITDEFEFNVEVPKGSVFSGLFDIDAYTYVTPYECSGNIKYKLVPKEYVSGINPNYIRVYNNVDYLNEIDTKQDFNDNTPFIKNSLTDEVRQGVLSCDDENYNIDCGSNLMAVVETVSKN